MDILARELGILVKRMLTANVSGKAKLPILVRWSGCTLNRTLATAAVFQEIIAVFKIGEALPKM